MASTDSRTESKSLCVVQAMRTLQLLLCRKTRLGRTVRRTGEARRTTQRKDRTSPPGRIHDESLETIHSPPYCNFAAHGSNSAGGSCCFLPVAGIGAAGGRLSHHAGGYVLPRR